MLLSTEDWDQISWIFNFGEGQQKNPNFVGSLDMEWL